MRFTWSEEKNEFLKATRGIGFEDVVAAYESGAFHNSTAHENQARYPGQMMMVIEVGGYLCRVPFIWQDSDIAFLKTIYPSRKEMRKWNRS
jgi:uncharacterized DUF497 family protein